MTLGQKQRTFTRMIGLLIEYAYQQGFEFYCILPWSETRDLRCRIGWKMMTPKFKEYGFAQLVTTCNPFDGYGKKVSEV